MHEKGWKTRLFSLVNNGLLLVVGLATIFPIYYTVILSFTDPVEYYQRSLILWPRVWTLDAYKHLLSNGLFVSSISVSVFLATIGTLLSLLVTGGMAYALSRKRLRFRKAMMIMVLLTFLFTPGLVPLYLVVRNLGLIDSVWSLILPSLTSAWYVLLMKGFFDSIPVSLEEAAMIDGSNDIGVFWRIILPLSLPALVAFGLFFAVGYWNTYFNALMFINDQKMWPLQVLLQNMLVDPTTMGSGNGGGFAFQVNRQVPTETLKMAAVVIATVPIMLVYPFLQKHFAKGAMVGSVKE
ncbi:MULTISPECIES: carbohydrate ABC transporter permease [Paenibacillus]|jgi:putative aldouronate transport system permease protein|uniref:Binding-protein-dependent transport systems inner membrane component n=2 Tax=Paenibacillus lactis TaxID=228574 RepID=G4HHA4_9BACL|nr:MULTISPECIES: carbohydrate ABC transporter permease [Paenibacillus]EHB63480.1 binding-protein-dependent transport systems inner membrane component [Paenibacillus lactis 154]MBP1891761.1 putative aldouronate transport system permease protein [Paenibacillus lactis]MCM3494220.1 carbohydrate ABC transporter permease [Paenibacillus lactis]GIO89002.1 putative ABC transporter permease protein YtcP [Paenibacillus lactis]HAF99210.1 carbohydrate ABC transporter permease [Paenibacillus lactis]